MRCRSVSLSCKGKINHLIRLPIVFTITGQLCFAGERFDPFVSAISRIDKDEGLVYIDRRDNVVGVGDVFVTAKPVQNGDASLVSDRRSVIGILRINPEEFVGKLLSGPMPGVNAVVERFGPLPAVIKSTTEKSGPVEEELKSMFPRLVWENEESKAEPSLTFELISKGRVVVTYDQTWLVGMIDIGAASYSKEESFRVAAEAEAELALELPGRAGSIAVHEIPGRYVVALEGKQTIRFFSGRSDGSVSEIAVVDIPRGERIIYMDWYSSAGGLYLLVNQWDDYRVSGSVVRLDGDRAMLVGFSPLMMGVHDTDLDGRIGFRAPWWVSRSARALRRPQVPGMSSLSTGWTQTRARHRFWEDPGYPYPARRSRPMGAVGCSFSR